MNKYKVIIPTYEEWNIIKFNNEESIKDFNNLYSVNIFKTEYDFHLENPSINKFSFKWNPNINDYPEIVTIRLGECFMYKVDEPNIWKVIKYEDIKKEWYIQPCV